MTVDEHIAEAIRLAENADSPRVSYDRANAIAARSNAHAAIASALLARYPGWGYAGCTPGEYDGIDL